MLWWETRESRYSLFWNRTPIWVWQIGKPLKDKHIDSWKSFNRFRVSFTHLSTLHRATRQIFAVTSARLLRLSMVASFWLSAGKEEQSSMCLHIYWRIQSTSIRSQINIRQIFFMRSNKRQIWCFGAGTQLLPLRRTQSDGDRHENYDMTVFALASKGREARAQRNSHRCKWQLMIL